MSQSLQSAWDNINDLQAESKTHSDFKRTSQQTLDSYQEEINLLKRNSASAVIQNQQAEIRALQASLEKEKEKIIALENYSRRENLCFMNQRDIWRTLNPDLSRFTWRNKSLKVQ